jgi:hypothetical protein
VKRRRLALEQAAGVLVDAIGEDSSLLIGGLALAAHGYLRATADVDMISRVPLTEARERLAMKGVASKLVRGELHEGDFDCLHGDVAGIRFDVMPQIVSVDWKRSPSILLPGGRHVLVASLKTLIHLKLIAGGPPDVVDIANLLRLHPEETEATRKLAGAYNLADQLETFMKGSRASVSAPPSPPGRRRARRPTTRSRS